MLQDKRCCQVAEGHFRKIECMWLGANLKKRDNAPHAGHIPT